MGETASERLRSYLAALPPRAQTLLLTEFERAIARGDNAAVARFVLGELRRVARKPEPVEAEPVEPPPRIDDPMRLVFRPLEPFFSDATTPCPGALRRVVVTQIWQWLKRDGAPLAAERLNAALAATTDPARRADRGFAVSDFQRAAAVALATAAAVLPADQKALLARLGPAVAMDDLALMADLLRARDSLEALSQRLPAQVREFGMSQVLAFEAALAVPALQSRSLMPFALTLAMRRLPSPWQIIRLATKAADSDNEQRLAATPQAVAITLAIQALAGIAAHLREDLRCAALGAVPGHLKTLHDGVRGLLSEIDIRPDSIWGRQIAAVRADASTALRAQIVTLPARVRRLLRQRPVTDINAATRLDAIEVEEATALIGIVETCRGYANELAINEVSLRVHAELTQYIGPTADALIAALGDRDTRSQSFRRQQADAAIAFSRVLFGDDHAARMRRSADMATAGEAQARSA